MCKRHHRFATDGTWDKLLRVIQAGRRGRSGGLERVGRLLDRAGAPAFGYGQAQCPGGCTVLVEHTGAVSNDKNARCCRDEPGDQALGRSRGGLSTKIHAAVDGRGCPLAILLAPGQDAPMMLPLLPHLRVQRTIGRPPTRPDRVPADEAYSSRAIRGHLRTRGIGSVIPKPDDQKAHRKRIGSSGGRPVTYDRTAYRGRNVSERASTASNAGAGWPPDTTSTPSSTAAASSSQPYCSGSPT